ncbi:Uncharacterised protein [Mycobacteroides abscessus subsp. abscessus]|nr:Uncharacterised protein [Mycobacteroides abscessus subsp. abscessus]
MVNSVRSPAESGWAASRSAYCSSSGTASARNSSTVRSGARNPASASKRSNATTSSGLWLSSR